MSSFRSALKSLLLLGLLLKGGLTNLAMASQKEEDTTVPQLPPELRGAKIYRFPDETKPGTPPENPVIYRNIAYGDINFERLLLDLFVSIKPTSRAATIRKIFFQDVRVNGVPVHIETFEEEFKLSKKDVVDFPAPLKCSIVFADLESLTAIKEIINQDQLRITGQSFIDVKLNPLEKLALRTKRLVLPVKLNEEVPLQMFSGNPLLQLAVSKVLDTLSDPSSSSSVALAKEHLAKLTESRALASAARPSLYLISCEYGLRDPKTQAAEKFSQSGSGFVVSTDGKLLTAKRVIQPWKFDPEITFLMERHHLELDPRGYRLWAWPVGVRVRSPDGQPDYQTALGTEQQTLKLLKTAPDRMDKQDYQDPDSGEKATLRLHASGADDLALLQLVGSSFRPLAFADPSSRLGQDLKTILFGFPFGMSQAEANPQPVEVRAIQEGSLLTLEHQLNPGESGAPLLTPEGKVLGLAGGPNECIPIEAARRLIE